MPGKHYLKIEAAPENGFRYGLPYAAGIVSETASGFSRGDRVLIQIDAADVRYALRQPQECVDLSNIAGSCIDIAFLLPPLGFALMLAQQTGFEIGEAALVAGKGIIPDLVCAVLKWKGALPCIRLDNPDGNCLPGLTYLPDDPGLIMDGASPLVETIKKRSGLVYFDTGDNPDFLELLIEHFPMWSRIVLAGNHRRKINLDYYNDIHKKGATLLFYRNCAAGFFSTLFGSSGYLSRAARILEGEKYRDDLRTVFPKLNFKTALG